MKIAIVGAGISGLSASYRLGRLHDVTLFEANHDPGGHTRTVDIVVDGEHHAIDTGFIVFNDRTYPRFVELLAELGVRSRPTSMSFSVHCERTGLEYNGSSLNGLFAQRRNLLRPSFYRMIRDILRFNREASRQLSSGAVAEMTVGEFLARGHYTREFSDHYLLPMGSAIWSAPIDKFERFPIRFIIEFFANHGLLDLRDRPTWRVIEGGSRNYVRALLARMRGLVRLDCPIQRVRRTPTHVEVMPRGGPSERFDHVVLACHADQALRMLDDATPTERELLSAFPYQRSTAVLHTDARLLPRRPRAWASWNYRLRADRSAGASVTYCMSILQHIASRQVFNVTLNDDGAIDPSRVLSRFEFHHPLFTTQRAAAQARHGELTAAGRTSFCGAYWGNGFHEDGVVSALAVCRAIERQTTPATGNEVAFSPPYPACESHTVS